ncbi:MAG: 5'-methylthioadenosine/S-adenosylhomocysteine nucleosidase [Alkalispirochaeta sp.]
MEMIDVAVVTALTEEAALFHDEFALTPLDLGALPGGDARFHRGETAAGLSIVVIVTGPGRAAAAEGMALFFSQYRPHLVIAGGIAGGVGAEVSVGDVVIADETVCYDEDATALKMPLGTLRRERASVTPAPDSLALRDAAAGIAGRHARAVRRGRIASGDTLLTRRTLSALPENRRRMIEGAIAVDMESSVWMAFAHRGGTPIVLTRFISDHVTGGDRLGFVHACETIGEIITEMLRSCRMGPDGAIVMQ